MDFKNLFFFRNLKNSRKAQISIQFNWILVLIIGGVIVMFFVGIVQKQGEYSEKSISGTIQTDLRAILSSSYVSTGTASIVEIPNKEIFFSCEGFRVGDQFASQFPYAFAPNSIKSERNTISIFASDWSIPYKIVNFLYMTSPNVKYIIVEDNNIGLEQALDELLPNRYITKEGESKLFIDKEIGEPENDNNNYKVRVIYFTDPVSIPLTFKNNFRETEPIDISVLYIEPSNCPGSSDDRLNCNGFLKFFNYEDGSWKSGESKYIGKASVLAAVFSENIEIYECGMKNALLRLQNVTNIYEHRTASLRDFYDSSHACNGLLNNALTTLYGISNAASTENYDNLFSLSNELDAQNDNILANSCPAIY